MFFKKSVRRWRWPATGPSTPGATTPTVSLAMGRRQTGCRRCRCLCCRHPSQPRDLRTKCREHRSPDFTPPPESPVNALLTPAARPRQRYFACMSFIHARRQQRDRRDIVPQDARSSYRAGFAGTSHAFRRRHSHSKGLCRRAIQASADWSTGAWQCSTSAIGRQQAEA